MKDGRIQDGLTLSYQYSYKKQPSKLNHCVKKTFSFPDGGNCPPAPTMYSPTVVIFRS